MTAAIEVGDKVQAGKGEDHDVGKVWELREGVDGDEARVGWESGVATWMPVRMLEVV